MTNAIAVLDLSELQAAVGAALVEELEIWVPEAALTFEWLDEALEARCGSM